MKRKAIETKLRAIEMYRSGKSPITIGRLLDVSGSQVVRWANSYEKAGKVGLNRHYRPLPSALKIRLVEEVLGGKAPCEQVALANGVGRSSLCRWVSAVRESGSYDVLRERIKEVDMGRPKKKQPETELERLQLENEYLRAENALLKKVKALVEAREARERGTGRKPSRN